jgi:DNA-directed RNA polymerase subunit RPC12/RpoP
MRPQKQIIYPKEDDKADTIKKLKGVIKRLEKEKRQLKSELATLEAAFSATGGFIKKQMWDYSVEEAIDAAKKQRRLEATIKPDTIQCDKCGSPMDSIDVPIGKVITCQKCDHRYTIKKVAGGC